VSGRPTLVHHVDIAAPPERVWKAITEPAYVEQYFFALRPRGDWLVGARIVYETASGATHLVADLREIQPARRLRYAVRLLRSTDTAGDLPSRVTWEIEPTATGCRLTVVHDEFEGETETYRRMGGGWPTALAGLKELVETGRAVRAQRAWPPDITLPPIRPEDRVLDLNS